MTIQAIHQLVWHRCHTQSPPYDPRLKAMIPPEQYPDWLMRHQCRYYLYLHTLVTVLQPKKVLELGTQAGGSTLFLLLALPEESTLITVDSDPTPPVYLQPCLEDPRLHRMVGHDLDLHLYGSLDLDGLDLLFIDTLHTYEQVAQEWRLYTRFLRPGAVVVLDDIHLNGGMERFWEEIKEPKVDTGGAFHWSGWGVVQAGP